MNTASNISLKQVTLYVYTEINLQVMNYKRLVQYLNNQFENDGTALLGSKQQD
ncbi:hypothetical protein [Chryseobacterium balustinum]|uniref:hypothetical protein n=1 Tax=Chryseobacterium balustinum TaxID=246 RepID=UPI003CFB31C4